MNESFSIIHFSVGARQSRLARSMTASRQPAWIAAAAFTALAVAMGIGRFAFTPVLPMMQQDFGEGVREGGWLASANYLGYFLGALSAMHRSLSPRLAIRLGLVVIALGTMAMPLVHGFTAWWLLRFFPGLASAWVLVFTSAWALEHLTRSRRPALSGVMYAGVGGGMVFAKAAYPHALIAGFGADMAWAVMGLASLLATMALWPLAPSASTPAAPPASPGRSIAIPGFGRLVFCYGAFGLGYIIPATFLPVMARQAIADPAVFGWAWPIFGAAAAASTWFAARLSESIGARAVWSLGSCVMAIGVLAPLAVPGPTGIVLAALAVGGTFMVNTMAGMQEARRIGGTQARHLMAAMTSAFAAGQIVGPLLVGALIPWRNGFAAALIIAASVLLVAAWILVAARSVHERA